MQIIPENRADSAFGFFTSADTSDGSGFMEAMQNAMSAVEDGDNHSVSSALAEDSRPLVDSPYNVQSTDGVTYTLEEVTFTKNELEELRRQLVREGAPEESLRQFDILAGQPDGATLAQVMASLTGRTAGNFSEDDAQAITALLGQIDPSGALATDALDFMRQGNGQAALGLIQDALAKLPADQGMDIDPDAMLALGRGLGLNNGTMQSIIGMMGGQSLTLNGAQFATLMEPAKNQFTLDAGNAQKLEAALEKTLKPIISRARDRMEKEKEAVSRESRRVQQSRILIDQTVQKNSRETMDETLAGEQAEAQARGGAKAGEAAAKMGRQLESQPGEKAQADLKASGNERLVAENAKFAANTHAAADAKNDFADANAGDGKNGKSDVWQDLLSRIETKPAASAQTSAAASSFVYSMLNGNLNANLETQILDMEAQLTANSMRQMTQQLAQQVENGVLTAMRDGATRLDLQLHPAELGNLAITLIARNGEITAQIRSEKGETAEMLQRQMDAMRVNLEQQGVKVDKIEVMLENHDSSQDFVDMGQHNARQEEEARRQEFMRLRNLAALRNDDRPVAQQLHDSGQQATHAGSALHVVA